MLFTLILSYALSISHMSPSGSSHSLSSKKSSKKTSKKVSPIYDDYDDYYTTLDKSTSTTLDALSWTSTSDTTVTSTSTTLGSSTTLAPDGSLIFGIGEYESDSYKTTKGTQTGVDIGSSENKSSKSANTKKASIITGTVVGICLILVGGMMIRRRRKNTRDKVDGEIEEVPTHDTNQTQTISDAQGYLVPVPSIKNSDEFMIANYEAVEPELDNSNSNSNYQRASLFSTYEMANSNSDTQPQPFEDTYYEIAGEQPTEILYDEAGFEECSHMSTLYTLANSSPASPEYDIATNKSL